MKIRSATLNDAQLIAQFNQKMALETENKVLPDELIIPGVEAVLIDPVKGQYFVAEVDGVMRGQLMITYEWSDWRNNTIWWIQSVYVEEAFRGQGLYKALYEAVKEAAQKAHIQTIRLYVEKENFTAQKVYEKLGMEETVYAMYEATLQ